MKAGKTRMDINEVKDLIQEILQSDISEFELEHTDTKIRLKRGFAQNAGSAPQIHAHPATVSPASSKPIAAEAIAPKTNKALDADDQSLHIVTSPIVGTVYRAPNPNAESYVKLGDKIHEGSILCLVEAMKLMNEIPSDISGEIARIYIEDAHPVEFGQKLFGIRPEKQG
jgi:acetyl-CoA carboxylase biotin carboxyl carrier protein